MPVISKYFYWFKHIFCNPWSSNEIQTCMKGSPAKARVVYAPVLEVGGEGRLARACSILLNFDEVIFVKYCVYLLLILWIFSRKWSVYLFVQYRSLSILVYCCDNILCICFTWLTCTLSEVITDAFVKSGLVFERDARELKVCNY